MDLRVLVNLRRLFKEYYKYCLVGGVVTALDFGILALEVEIMNVHYLVAACISYIIASVVHYILSAKYVFVKSKTKKDFRAFSLFFILGVIGLALFELFMWIFVEKFGLYYLLAKVFATGITFTFNFATRKLFLFK